MSLRLFLAIPIPDEIKKRVQGEVYSHLKPSQKDLKAVPSQNLHITLRFLGYHPEEKILGLKEKLGELSQQHAFEIELKKIGAFQNRVLWLGIEKGKRESETLAEIIAKKLGLGQEPFSGHLTLCRNKNLSGAEWKKMVEHLEQQPFEARFVAESVHLMRSHLKPDGPEYQTIHAWKLRAR